MTEDIKRQAKHVAADNGVENPSGALVLFVAPMYLALVPVTSFLTKPDSIVQSLTHAFIKLLPGVGVRRPSFVFCSSPPFPHAQRRPLDKKKTRLANPIGSLLATT